MGNSMHLNARINNKNTHCTQATTSNGFSSCTADTRWKRLKLISIANMISMITNNFSSIFFAFFFFFAAPPFCHHRFASNYHTIVRRSGQRVGPHGLSVVFYRTVLQHPICRTTIKMSIKRCGHNALANNNIFVCCRCCLFSQSTCEHAHILVLSACTDINNPMNYVNLSTHYFIYFIIYSLVMPTACRKKKYRQIMKFIMYEQCRLFTICKLRLQNYCICSVLFFAHSTILDYNIEVSNVHLIVRHRPTIQRAIVEFRQMEWN